MAHIRITREDGTVEQFEDVAVQLPDSFVTISGDDYVEAIHERHVRRATLTGIEPPPSR